LDVDYEVRLAQILGQTGVLAAQLFHLLRHQIALGLRPALARSQDIEDAVGSLAPPIGQQRRVQTSRAPTPPGVSAAASASCRMASLYSAVKVRRFGFAATSGSGCEASTASAPALAGAERSEGERSEPQRSGAPAKLPEDTTPRECPLIAPFCFLALLINY